ncbi:hypothetical protein FRB94_010446 [Tulasnella sp. JGI-2019a]|nr:hypothetical protein FRB94_010446 [Tulasnella sp. JGI-2019a]KAG9018298.1 hypothetical protein FRB93_000001 [Tulasnella sp. JGI-2019a]KAG9030048.1 hypothetical protein FRB95_004635 [Tulasnella sp. JGI-2019a]
MSDPKANDQLLVEVPKEFRVTSPSDCILRSSDEVDYKVFQNILSLASPVFRSMFDLPQTPNTTPQGSDTASLPVISVAESSSILSKMLLLIYPCRFTDFTDLELILEMIKVYDKYDMDTRSLHQSSLHYIFVSNKTLSESPLEAYAIAWRLDMKEEAQNASKYLHLLDLNTKAVKKSFLSWAESGGLDALSALWDLRMKREEALDGLIDAVLGTGACPRQHLTQTTTRAKARIALNTPNPSCFDIISFLGIGTLAPGSRCGGCNKFYNVPRGEAEIRRDTNLVNSFPQTISWKDESIVAGLR